MKNMEKKTSAKIELNRLRWLDRIVEDGRP